MKNSVKFSERAHLLIVFSFLIICSSVIGQDNPKTSAPLPDNINKIVSACCMPCHSSKGGMLSKAKLNFSEWTEYSADKQKKKAEKMYKELKKDAMPPKDARETNPDIIPTKEQIEIIKAWADSF
jgi:hypothetical protein